MPCRKNYQPYTQPLKTVKGWIQPLLRYAKRYKTETSGYLKDRDPLTYGNKKLHKSIAIFDLPAGMKGWGTCGRECKNCFALRDERGPRGEDVSVKRCNNYLFSQRGDFAEGILASIDRKKGAVKAVRVHSAGDFYSQEYVDKWVTIAEAALVLFPKLKFYAYTKRKGDFDFSELEAMENFVVIDSFQYGQLNYGDRKYCDRMRRVYGAKICPCGIKDEGYTSKEYGKLPREYRELNKICGVSCKYCQVKRAQDKAPMFLEH